MQSTFSVKNGAASKVESYVPESGCMKRSVTRKSDIRIRPRLSILNT